MFSDVAVLMDDSSINTATSLVIDVSSVEIGSNSKDLLKVVKNLHLLYKATVLCETTAIV